MFLIIFRAARFLTRMGIAVYWECPYCGTSFFHGEGRWTKYLPIHARMFIFTEKLTKNINAKSAKCSKGHVHDDKCWSINCKKNSDLCRKKQYKCIQIYAKNPIMQRASLGLVTSKCINPPSTFCFAGKTEVYTQGITLHWVTRSEIILDLMFKLELKCWFDESIIWKVSTRRTRFSQGAEEGKDERKKN